jgi:hypothetical protein
MPVKKAQLLLVRLGSTQRSMVESKGEGKDGKESKDEVSAPAEKDIKMELKELNTWVRATCKQALPVCGDICGACSFVIVSTACQLHYFCAGRALACGYHTCPQKCHDSPCSPCTAMVRLSFLPFSC